MSEYKLFDCDMHVPCDTFQCFGRASFFIGKEDAPKSTLTKVCDQCANELIGYVLKSQAPAESDEPATDEISFKEYEDMNYIELKSFAKRIGLTGFHNKSKPDLISMIKEATDLELGVE